MDHVWLEKLPQHVAQHLKGKQRSWVDTISRSTQHKYVRLSPRDKDHCSYRHSFIKQHILSLNQNVWWLTKPTFSSPKVLLVLNGISQRGHDFLLFKGQDAKTFDQTGQTVRCSFPLCILVTLQQQLQQVSHNPSSIFFNGWD